MNTFNEFALSLIEEYLKMIYKRITSKDKNGRVLELTGFDIIESDEKQIGELISEGATNVFEVEVLTNIINPDGTASVHKNSLEIPKMTNNMFIVDGKYRVATYSMNNSNLCRIYKNHKNNGQVKISFDWNRYVTWEYPDGNNVDHPYDRKFFTLHITDEDGEVIDCPATPEYYEKYKDLLELTDEQLWRIELKLNKNLDSKYINEDLIIQMYDYGDDSLSDGIDIKQINNIEKDFRGYLYNPGTIKNVYTGISAKFWKLEDIYLKDLQNALKSYFVVARSKFVEIPSNVNPLVYDALRYKVTFPKYISYNKTFTDIIDPANTPENTNVNVINELNVCTSVEEGELMITCYSTHTGKMIKLNYYRYLNEKVLCSEYYDYENKEVIKSDSYFIKLRFNKYEISSKDLDSIEYVEPSPDERLSISSRRIPLVNMCDTIRVAMGVSMLKQAIETVGAQPRLVTSGNDDVDYYGSTNIISYNHPIPGKVVSVNSEEVTILDDNGTIVKFDVPVPIKGSNDSMITYDTSVKVGDKVAPNEVIISPSSMKGGNYSLGVNARTVYINYLGYSHEDGVIISESYSRRNMSYNYIRGSMYLSDNDIVSSILQIGSKVKSGNLIAQVQSEIVVDSKVGGALSHDTDVLNITRTKYKVNNLVVPNNIAEGYLVDLKISFRDARTGSDVTSKVLEEYPKLGKVSDYEVLPQKFMDLRITSSPDFEVPDRYFACIEYIIVKCNPMKIGDKSSNSYGSKGEISLIVPDELMPRINPNEDGTGGTPAEIIMNPAAVISRKNISQLYEINLTRCIEAIYEVVRNLVDSNVPENVTHAKNFTEKFYGNRFLKISDEEFVKKVNDGILNFNMKVGSYSKISYDTLMKWMKDLDVKEGDPVFCPDVFIYEDESGTKVCSPEYAEEHHLTGKLHELGWLDGTPITGLSYMYKLYHAADYSGKVTSSVNGNDPRMGRGLSRDSGQKIGEMEYWALSSHGKARLITQNKRTVETPQNEFMQHLLLAGFLITDDNGLPIVSKYRNKLNKLKEKFNE